MAEDIILETRGLRKEFKGFVAVSDVSLKVRRGRIHALIGPNGAGKIRISRSWRTCASRFSASAGARSISGERTGVCAT